MAPKIRIARTPKIEQSKPQFKDSVLTKTIKNINPIQTEKPRKYRKTRIEYNLVLPKMKKAIDMDKLYSVAEYSRPIESRHRTLEEQRHILRTQIKLIDGFRTQKNQQGNNDESTKTAK